MQISYVVFIDFFILMNLNQVNEYSFNKYMTDISRWSTAVSPSFKNNKIELIILGKYCDKENYYVAYHSSKKVLITI